MSTVTLGRDGQPKSRAENVSLSVLVGLAAWMLLAYRVAWPHLDRLTLCGAGELSREEDPNPAHSWSQAPTPPDALYLQVHPAASCCDCGLLMAHWLFPSPKDCPWLSLRLHILSREAACNRLIHGDRRSAPGFKVGLKLCYSSASGTAQEIRLRLVSSGDHTQT